LANTCAADNARVRLAEGVTNEHERTDLEIIARGCDGETVDPWTPSLMWPGCPGKLAMRRDDIDAALTLRGLSTMAPLTDWPHGYSARVVEVWTLVESERRAFDEARRGNG
jgi:hypothetical protein